mgnify:CR=1 FL=1
MNHNPLVTAGGDTVNQILPYLQIIADQNGLNLSRLREFKIARQIYERSIFQN